ncbi:MAG: protein phosphatase 2C domain-containing protein [Candidatus Faecousia sp.]|nr:protein phosphatase 2C domain-containing protein [Candidatus Faecousia sp.]
MDILDQLPPEQPGQTLSAGDFAGFAVSVQGASHAAKEPAVPCQDYSALRCLAEEGIVLAAIADGVGSCSLSHWGAYTAVCAALDSGEKGLKRLSGGRPMRLGSRENAKLKAVLVQAFRDARAAVEQLADQAQELVFSFQSTLTLAIYDGRDLYYGHAGDDGIVVQTRDGEVEMVTARLKGEEASSVYPLQSGEAMWHFGKSAKPVAAFVMATDGVLDAFVTNREDYYGVNYCKGVCYAFMEEAVYTLGKKEPNTPKEALDKYLDYLKSPAYRAAVTDDLTLAAVVSREQLAAGKHPRFSMQIWNTVQEESRAARRRLLNHKAPLDAGPGDLFGPLVEETPRRPAPEPEPPVQPDRAQGRTPERTPDRERPGWYIPVTILLVLLLAGAALIGGIALGRLYFPKIAPEEYSAAVRQRDDLARQAETLTQEKEALEETLTQLEDALEQSRAECAASAEQTAQLQEEAAALRQQLEDLEARYAETEETPE